MGIYLPPIGVQFYPPLNAYNTDPEVHEITNEGQFKLTRTRGVAIIVLSACHDEGCDRISKYGLNIVASKSGHVLTDPDAFWTSCCKKIVKNGGSYAEYVIDLDDLRNNWASKEKRSTAGVKTGNTPNFSHLTVNVAATSGTRCASTKRKFTASVLYRPSTKS